MITTDARDSAGSLPTHIMKMDGISLLDSEEDELARGFAPLMVELGPADMATLDALITSGITVSRSAGARWVLARVREQPAYAELSGRLREASGLDARAGMDRVTQDPRQSELDARVKELFPAHEVQRVALLHYGDDPGVEPGDLLVRVIIEEAEEDPPLRAWERDHQAICRELHRDLAERLPEARYLEFWFGGDTGNQGRSRQRLRCAPDDPARPKQDLNPADIRLGPADLQMLDTLIAAGIVASRAEAIGWALARIRERPAYAKLSERARELDELKARF